MIAGGSGHCPRRDLLVACKKHAISYAHGANGFTRPKCQLRRITTLGYSIKQPELRSLAGDDIHPPKAKRVSGCEPEEDSAKLETEKPTAEDSKNISRALHHNSEACFPAVALSLLL